MYPDSRSAEIYEPSLPLFGGTTGLRILPVVLPPTIDVFFDVTGDNGDNLFSSLSILRVIEFELPLVLTLISFCSLGTDDLLS